MDPVHLAMHVIYIDLKIFPNQYKSRYRLHHHQENDNNQEAKEVLVLELAVMRHDVVSIVVLDVNDLAAVVVVVAE